MENIVIKSKVCGIALFVHDSKARVLQETDQLLYHVNEILLVRNIITHTMKVILSAVCLEPNEKTGTQSIVLFFN